jgi:hypothetical protein
MSFTISIRDIPYNICTNFEKHCGIYRLKYLPLLNKPKTNLVKSELEKFNATVEYGSLTFDTEADYTFFLLRWS